eukprot:2709291-Rhodomonas_salina.1
MHDSTNTSLRGKREERMHGKVQTADLNFKSCSKLSSQYYQGTCQDILKMAIIGFVVHNAPGYPGSLGRSY